MVNMHLIMITNDECEQLELDSIVITFEIAWEIEILEFRVVNIDLCSQTQTTNEKYGCQVYRPQATKVCELCSYCTLCKKKRNIGIRG